MRLAAIILAAGESRRMGRAKALLPFRDGTFLSVLAGTLAPYCSPVVAVFGFDGEAVAAGAPAGVVPVVNRDYRLGMLTSLQTGLRALVEPGGRILQEAGAVSCLPWWIIRQFRARRWKRLIAAGADIAIPRIAGKRGHPVLMRARSRSNFWRSPALRKSATSSIVIPAPSATSTLTTPASRDDVDDPALYEALLAREAAQIL